METTKKNVASAVERFAKKMLYTGLVLVVFIGPTGIWALWERDGRLMAEKQAREGQATLDGLVSAAIELTSLPCAKNDMVDLGANGFAIGGVWMPHMTAEHVRRHVSKTEAPGSPTTYVYVDGPNSTPRAELIARKPECRAPMPSTPK